MKSNTRFQVRVSIGVGLLCAAAIVLPGALAQRKLAAVDYWPMKKGNDWTYITKNPAGTSTELITVRGVVEDAQGKRAPFRVQSVRGGFVNLLDLRDYRLVRMRLTDTLELQRIATPADLRMAVVVWQQGAEAQLLDPDNYTTVTVILPSDAPLGAEVEVLRFDRDLYLVRGARPTDVTQDDSTA